MKAKLEARKLNPRLKSERHRDNGGRTYWLIREIGARMWFADGATEAQAWKSALALLKADKGKP